MNELIGMLTQTLGVDTRQAEGGAGVLFKAAQEKLGAGEFGKLLGALPGITDLMAKAPAAGGGGLGGLLGGLAGAVGGNAAIIANILGGFGKLGLNADHAKQFVPVILQFLRSKVSPDIVSRLEQALKG